MKPLRPTHPYIPMARGFVYLAVVLDWFSRRVLSWRVSITMEAAFCVETLEEALAKHGKPKIFNTDQGSQFTGAAFTGLLIKNGNHCCEAWNKLVDQPCRIIVHWSAPMGARVLINGNWYETHFPGPVLGTCFAVPPSPGQLRTARGRCG